MITESWLFWALLAAAFAALMTIFAKLGLADVDPDVAQFVRTAVVLVAIALLVFATDKWPAVRAWNGRTWLYLVLSGLATGASWLCYFRALHVGAASRVAAVDKLSVLFVAVIAAIALQERLSATGWCGVALATAGLVMLTIAR